MRLFNTILTRNFENCEYSVLKVWYEINKRTIEDNFYKNDILMSGTVRKREGDILEIIYLKYFADSMKSIDDVLDIYSNGERKFPTYNEYISLIQRFHEIDVVNKIIRKLVPFPRTIKINHENYLVECQRISSYLNRPFKRSIVPEKREVKRFSGVTQEIIEEKELSFVGIAMAVSINSFDKMLCYKILEKLFGSNDTYGIYFKFREKGWIYTGLTGYVIENNLFYTGAIMQYDNKHAKEILINLDQFTFSHIEFKNAKQRVLDDYKYTVFQYGEEYALLPYKMRLKNVSKFEECLERIVIEDVQKELIHIHTYKQLIRMKVV